MWIRTQDKETLLNVNCIDVYNLNKNEWIIEACGNDLGTYNSKERALEILDEISKQVSINKAIEICSNLGDMTQANRENYIYTQVYQMPEV